MEFLAPNLLWALPLAGLPLLLYWWQRQQAEEMDYPSLAWLDEEFREQLQRTHQQKWLQVLWRILLIILLIYTLSQPIIGQGSQPRERVLVFIDNSMSMEQTHVGQTALDASKEWVEQTLAENISGERLRVGKLLPEPQIVTGGRSSLSQTLSNIRTRPGRATLSDLNRWLAEQAIPKNTRVIVVTDAQQHFFDLNNSDRGTYKFEIKTPVPELDNATLTDGYFSRTPQFINRDVPIRWKTQPAGVTPEKITINGEETIVPSSSDEATWSPDRTGYRAVTVTLPDDVLNWDNEWRFVGNVRRDLRIYFAGSSPAIRSFKYTLKNNATETDNPDRADLIVIGTSNVDRSRTDGLNEQNIQSTPRLIVAGKDFDRRSFARLDSNLDIPWEFEGLIEPDEPTFPVLEKAEWFQGGQSNASELINKLSIHSYYRIDSPENTQPIISVDGEPLFANHNDWYVLTAPPEQFLTPGSASAQWPSLLLNTVRGIIQSPRPPSWFVGEKIEFEKSYSFPVTIQGPDDNEITIETKNTRWAPAKTGFYRIYGAGGEQAMRAVNHVPDEGNLSRLPIDKWPGNTAEFREQSNRINLSLAPWLWLLFVLGLCFDVWWGNRI